MASASISNAIRIAGRFLVVVLLAMIASILPVADESSGTTLESPNVAQPQAADVEENGLNSAAVALRSAAGVGVASDDHALALACQSTFGAVWSIASALAVLPPIWPLSAWFGTKSSADYTAYKANLKLKLCAPAITAPGTVKRNPYLTADGPACHALFFQSTTQADYENILGIPTSALFEENWGELGTPSVFHFNSTADVRLLDPSKVTDDEDPLFDPSKVLGLEDDAWLTSDGILRFDVGRNKAVWRASTMVSIVDLLPLFLIPLVVNGLTDKIVLKNPVLKKKAVDLYMRLTKGLPKLLRWLVGKLLDKVQDLPEKTVELILEKAVGWDWRTETLIGIDASSQDVQEVWVYDTAPPTLETDRSGTLPPGFSEEERTLLTYDPVTDTYYLEAFRPRIADAAIGRYGSRLLTAHDECQGDRPALVPYRLGSPERAQWLPGDTGTLQWQVADSGPANEAGDSNVSNIVEQNFAVRDSFPPILLAPPSRVIETRSNTATVPPGSPRVFDLADLVPTVESDAPEDFEFDLGINIVTWTATDASGNSASQEQMINVKLEGANTAPVSIDQQPDAVSHEQVEIILTGLDSDSDPNTGRHDPLTFTIADRPANGFFIAPLLPYFIDDYRLEASALRFAGEPEQEDPVQYCRDLADGLATGPDRFQMSYPYQAEWISVDDDGVTVVYDDGDMVCDTLGGGLATNSRLAVFGSEGELLHHTRVNGTFSDVYIDWRTKGIYATDNTDPGRGDVEYYDKRLNNLGRFETNTPGTSNRTLSTPTFIAADSQGIVYVGERFGRVAAYEGPSDATDFLGYESYDFLGILHEDSDMRDIATDSDNNLYVSMPDRILKFGPSSLDGGVFKPGSFIGWMGQCDSNLTNSFSCDTENERSLGFSCTDALCGTQGVNYGSGPAQFNDARGIAVDPNDILYVSDYGNSRVQRFTEDGDFAGEAKSTGVGYGFILGDFGRPEGITVNSDSFYILQRDLLHVMKSNPVTPIDDASAKVTYQSMNNFVGVDQFTFETTDGLASDFGTVTVTVARNYRPPVISVPPSYEILEDESAAVTLVGSDPDGDLDILDFDIVEQPRHGSLTGEGANLIYTPNADYVGRDSFDYRVDDGVFQSDPATVELIVTSVEDAPQVKTEALVSAGLGFTIQLPIEVFDPDEGEEVMATVDWGDGSPVETDGYITRDGVFYTGDPFQADGTMTEGLDSTGPLLVLGADGVGNAVFEHAFVTEGDFTGEICVTDRVEIQPNGTKRTTAASKTSCFSPRFSVSLAADLALVMTSRANGIDTGATVDPGAIGGFTVTVANRPFDVEPGITGPDVENVVVSGQHGDALSLIETDPSQGDCAIEVDSFICDLGDIAFGQEATIEVEVLVDELAPGNALLTLTANREADSIEPLEQESFGFIQVTAPSGPPIADSVDPRSGTTVGGEVVTIKGHNLDADLDVTFGDLPASQIEVVDSETVTLVTPAHIAGTVDVVVINSDGQSSTQPDAYSFTVSESSTDTVPPTQEAPDVEDGPDPQTVGPGEGSGSGGLAAMSFALLTLLAGAGGLLWIRRRKATDAGER